MADTTTTIPGLDAATTLAGTEETVVWQNSEMVRVSVQNVANTASALGAITVTGLTPATDNAAALGSASKRWSDAYIASGGILNWANGDYTLTHSSGLLTASGALKSASATGGIGYATGAGDTVTQASSRTTGVEINTVCGAITLVSAAGSATPASFTVTNSAVAATDTIILNQKSGTDLYVLLVTAVADGSFEITSYTTGGTTSEQPVFNFVVIKGVAA